MTPAMYINRPEDDNYIFNVAQDTANFNRFYGYSWRPHWDADENADWRSNSGCRMKMVNGTKANH